MLRTMYTNVKVFDIGDTVEWTTGNIVSRGIVYEPGDDYTVVVCYEINGFPTKRKLEVSTENLRISNG